jgi:hypothetical protein
MASDVNQLDLGLLVVSDQESGNRAHPLAKYKVSEATLVTRYAIPKQNKPKNWT